MSVEESLLNSQNGIIAFCAVWFISSMVKFFITRHDNKKIHMATIEDKQEGLSTRRQLLEQQIEANRLQKEANESQARTLQLLESHDKVSRDVLEKVSKIENEQIHAPLIQQVVNHFLGSAKGGRPGVQ